MEYIEGIRMSVELFGWLVGGAYVGYIIDEQIKRKRRKRKAA